MRISRPEPRETPLFRHRGGQAMRIPTEFELPGNSVRIWREGTQLIIEPVAPDQPRNLGELLARWRSEAPLRPEDSLPEIPDSPVQPEDPL